MANTEISIDERSNIMTDLVNSLNELINDVMLHAQSYGMSYSEAYFDKINTILTENGDVKELVFSEYRNVDDKQRLVRADGYSFEVEDGTEATNVKEMTIVLSDYEYDTIGGEVNEIKTINTAELEKKFLEVKRFIHACSSPTFIQSIAETAEYYGLVDILTKNFSKLEKITILYATTSRFSGRIKEFQAEDINGIKINKQIFDLQRHHSILTSRDGSEPTEIDFVEHGFKALTALKTNEKGNTQSMLLAVPGELLFRIYEEYGARLLEQNVRTYLQARGNVNKGMIATLRDNPERFFSYNNGLTATASDIKSISETESTVSIEGIKNLQIVNGGQTTASIHYAKFKYNVDLSRVYVQMKLSVVDQELLEAIVPKIAQFANTQNKVNAADFFANHPFHRQFEYLARANSTPRLDNSISNHGTHWYYERARGAYNNETYKLRTAAEKRAFSTKFPKQQLILKTDLAKYLMSFERRPDVVSKGAQAAFVEHANSIGLPENFEKKRSFYNDIFYKEAIAKTIIFREVDKLIQNSDWYEGGGTKACTVTYTIAWFAEYLQQNKQILDFDKVWKNQSMTASLKSIFKDLTPRIYEMLKNSTPEHLSAVTQWAKRKGCWDNLKSSFNFSFDDELLESVLTTKELHQEGRRSARRQQKVFNSEMHWISMVNLKPSTWIAIIQFCTRHEIYNEFSINQKRDLERLASLTVSQIRRSPITEYESKNLLPIFERLASLDFDFHHHGVAACLYE